MITEENFVDFTCPYCQGDVSFPETEAGRLQECPACSESLVVPAAGQAGAKPPLPAVTSRLKLRRFQAGDWKDLMECAPGLEEEGALAWLERDAHVRLTSPEQTFYLGLELVEGSKLVGYLSLKFTDAERLQAEISCELNGKYEGQGLSEEAVDALLGFCFKGIGLHRVTATVVGGGAEGCRLFKEVGMRREAEFVKSRKLDGEWVNTVCFAALEEEYGSEPPAGAASQP